MTAVPPLSEAASSPGAKLFSALGRFVFRYRDYLAPVIAILILLLTEPWPFLGSPYADRWLGFFGFVVALLGQAIRMTVIGYAYIVRGGVNKEIAAPRLVAEGFYAHSRNPMYLGNFLLIIGLALVYNSPAVYLVGLPLCIIGLVSIVRAEEEFLLGRFGAEYAEYCRRVPRFIPNMRGLYATLSGMQFDWRRVLRKEYGTTLAWTSAMTIFLAVEQVHWDGLSESDDELTALGVSWAVVFAAYLIVRWLKKSRRLESAPAASAVR